MTIQRRVLMQRSLAAGTVGAAVGAGILNPRAVLAAWPKEAFAANKMEQTLEKLFGTTEHAASGDIELKAPDIAENGAVVPVTITTTLPDVESISVVVENNPAPLAASFDMTPALDGYVSTRIKMGKTSNVLAVVRSGGKLYSASKEVKVTIGGCGG